MMRSLNRSVALGLQSATLAGAMVVYGKMPALAACTADVLTVTCTGDLTDIVDIDADGILNISIEDLTSDAVGFVVTDAAEDGAEKGDDGADASTIEFSFDGSSAYGAKNDNGTVFEVDLSGGDGAEGRSDTDAGSGGAGGGLTFALTNANVFDGTSIFQFQSTGGDGGTGEQLNVSNSGKKARGPDGGEAGDGGGLILVADGVFAEAQATSGPLIFMSSQGGHGGDGGEGRQTNILSGGDAFGGDGGTGGDGGSVEIILSNVDPAGASTEDNEISSVRVESVGGAGGDGGKAGAAAAAAYGGDGAGGGAGGMVDVDISVTSLATSGSQAFGVLARSYGGAGGTRGEGDSPSSYISRNGDSGGDLGTGTGGTVTVSFGGAISTTGEFSSGILAQSIGGFDGSAGTASTVETYGAGEQSGGESDLASVSVNDEAAISTNESGAEGVLVQSIGGGGGKATSDDDISSMGTGSHGGGNGGRAQVTVGAATIETQGVASSAVVVQSIGAGGGVALQETSSNAITSLGAEHGNGGAGLTVTADLNGATLITSKDFAAGVLLQSIGSGGGRGFNDMDLADDLALVLGASGGDGGEGGTVTLQSSSTSIGEIETNGDRAIGLQLQSIGGGGGDSLNDLTISSEVSVDLALGQSGGSSAGGVGNSVKVENTYFTISTTSDHSHGLLAQSIGGGGGSLSGLLDYSDSTVAQLGLTLGGSGGNGGNGGTVDIEVDEQVTTEGANAHGVIAQSIGGGGGEAAATLSGETPTDAALTGVVGGSGSNGGNGGAVTVTLNDTIDTQGTGSMGVVAQSIGGGGGFSNWLLSVDIGGDATFEASVGSSDDDSSGNASKVIVSNAGSIKTSGNSGTAIFAQAIGGGGGSAADGLGDLLTDIAVGGRGSGGGRGGDLEVTNTGTISTTGAGAMGIFVQSIGGGGGTVGDVERIFSSNFSSSAFGFGVLDQSKSGKGGDAGDITVATEGTITTTGHQAHGIWAQSLGGSGGAYGVEDGDAYAGNVGDTGTGGTIGVDVTEAMSLSGDYSTAIFAQSLGGSDSAGGAITIKVEADVSSSGTGGWGIVAQSDGGSGGGDITITVDAGASLSTGTSDVSGNEAIYILGAADATADINGTVSSETFDTVIVAKNSRLIIELGDTGTLRGNIELEDGQSNLFKGFGGTFESGDTIDLGDSGSYRNDGTTLSPAGVDSITDVSFSGEWSSAYTDGTLLFDIELVDGTAPNRDFITFETSISPRLNGTFEVNATGTSLLNSGDTGQAYIAEAPLAESLFDIRDLTVSDTATVDYEVAVFEDVFLEVSYSIDYTSDDLLLGTNQNAAGDHIDKLVSERKRELDAIEAGTLAASDENYAFVDTLVPFILNIATGEELKSNYDRLAPGDVFAAGDGALFSSLGFASALDACRSPVGVSTQTVGKDGSCAWFQAGASHHNRRRVGNSIDYDETAHGVAGGLITPLASGWYGGFAFEYESFDQSNARFASDGDRFQGGVLLRRDLGATSLLASVSGGYSEYDFTRTAFGIGATPVATANPNLWWMAGHARVGHTVTLSDWLTIEPSFDVGVTSYRQGAFNETGGEDYQLRISEIESTVFSFNPAVDFTTQFGIGGKATTATFRAGVLALAGDINRTATAQLDVAPGAGPIIYLQDDANNWFADLGAAIETRISERVTLEAEFDTLLSSDAQHYGGLARLKVEF